MKKMKMINTQNVSLAITRIIKTHNDFVNKEFLVPFASFTKYPIPKAGLLDRICKVGTQYNISLEIKTYRMCLEGIKKAKKELKG